MITAARNWRNWFFVGVLAMIAIRRDFSLDSLALCLAVAPAALAFWLIDRKVPPPARAWAQVMLASALLLAFLGWASWDGEWVLALVTWIVATACAVVLVRTYQQTGQDT
jgi:hypothetical protein